MIETAKRIARVHVGPSRLVFVEADRLGRRVILADNPHGRNSSSLDAAEARELGYALLSAAAHAQSRP